MSDDIVGLAHALLDAETEKGNIPTAWRVSPGTAARIADYFGVSLDIPENLTSFLELDVEVDPRMTGIVLLSDSPGTRVAHNDPISDILTDLIAELREMAEHDDHLTEWIGPSLEQAEARLREVQDV